MPKKEKGGPFYRHKVPEERDTPYTYNRSRTNASVAAKTAERKSKRQKHSTQATKVVKEVTFAANSETDISTEENSVTLVPSVNQSESVQHSAASQQCSVYIKYAVQLSSAKTMLQLDKDYRKVCMQNFSNGKLMTGSFVFIERKPMKFNNEYTWAYMCECSSHQVKYINGLSRSVQQSFNEVFTGQYKLCIHAETLKYMLECGEDEVLVDVQLCFENDQLLSCEDHSYGVEATSEVQVSAIPGHNALVCVCAKNGTYGIVTVDCNKKDPALTCIKCPKTKEPCLHISTVQSFLLDDDGGMEDTGIDEIRTKLQSNPKYRDITIPASLSTNKISFEGKKSVASDKLELKVDDSGNCSCGKQWKSADMYTYDVPLYTNYSVVIKTVISLKCLECNDIKVYDGLDDCVLNMDSFLMSHDVLRDYMRHFLTEGYSWYSFISLLDIDYQQGYICPTCGDSPETVIMDGISLGFRAIFLPAKQQEEFSAEQFEGSHHNERVCVLTGEARKLLKKFTDSDVKSAGLTESELNQLIDLLEIQQSGLYPLFKEFQEGNMLKCPKDYNRIIRALSKNSSVCGYIHPSQELIEILQDVASGSVVTDDAFKMKVLHEEAPSLHDMISSCSVLSDADIYLVKDILKKTQAPFKNRSVHNLPDNNISNQCSFFPSLPVQSDRGSYIMDSNKVYKEIQNDCEKFKFLKKKKGHPTLLPGLFTVMCTHGVCYGFELMENSESPNVPFTILRTRFRKAPHYIVYDNACNLQSYCLNRDPVFFRDSWFLVDRFHWKNHKGCSEGYNISVYPHLQHINSQAAEQRNSFLAKLKSMLSYMNFNNFMSHTKLFSWFISMLHIVQLSIDNLSDLQFVPFFRSLSKIYCK